MRTRSTFITVLLIIISFSTFGHASDAWPSDFDWELPETLTQDSDFTYSWHFNLSSGHYWDCQYDVDIYLSSDTSLSRSEDYLFYEGDVYVPAGAVGFEARTTVFLGSIPWDLPANGSYFVFLELEPGLMAPVDEDTSNNVIMDPNPIDVSATAQSSIDKDKESIDFGTASISENFSVWNDAAGTLAYSVSVILGDAYFSVTPDSGSSGGSSDKEVHTIQVNRVNISPGQMVAGRIEIASSYADDSPQYIELSATGAAGGIASTYIPPYGSYDDLQGRVSGVNPDDYKVAVYICVPPYGWWTKPYSNQPLTSIASDGTWICDITTGGNDPNATKIIAFLVPNGYNPPLGEGQQCLDSELYQYPYAEAIRYEKISFSGYDWWVKRAYDLVGPGPNYFSDSEENVWVDPNGHLHLKIAQRDGKWYCSEVIAEPNLGYGTYVFTAKGRVDLLDENIVLGLFTWEDCVPQYNYREIDIELSRTSIWRESPTDTNNAQFVIQPWDTSGNRYRFKIDLTGHPGETTTHELTWQQNGISFQSYHGDFSSNPLAEDIIASWHYTGGDTPPAGGENPRINFWLIEGYPPTDSQDVEIVIKNFRYLPIGDFCGANFTDADGYVDVWDLMQFADQWHTRTVQSNWDAKFDLTGPNFSASDGYVDVWDLMVFADNWHKGQKPE